MTLAITGATGQLGGRVARLLGADASRLVVRDPSRLTPEQVTGREVVVASYDDHDAAVVALRGVDVLFMVSAAESPVRREQHRTFIASAADAGVGHLVYTSFFGASPDATFTLGRDHADAEAAIRDTGMPFTLLRDNFYSDFFPVFAGEDGVIRGPAGDGRVAAVARDDVADVAAAVLRDSAAHVGATYGLTGPEAVTLTEAAARMSLVLDRAYTFHDETLDEAYASRRIWSDEHWQLDAWVSTYTSIRDGEVAQVTDDVPRLTGHPARTLEQAITTT